MTPLHINEPRVINQFYFEMPAQLARLARDSPPYIIPYNCYIVAVCIATLSFRDFLFLLKKNRQTRGHDDKNKAKTTRPYIPDQFGRLPLENKYTRVSADVAHHVQLNNNRGAAV